MKIPNRLSNRFIVTLPVGLERTIETAAKHRNCSKAEIIRAALYENLREFLSKDNTRLRPKKLQRVEKENE